MPNRRWVGRTETRDSRVSAREVTGGVTVARVGRRAVRRSALVLTAARSALTASGGRAGGRFLRCVRRGAGIRSVRVWRCVCDARIRRGIGVVRRGGLGGGFRHGLRGRQARRCLRRVVARTRQDHDAAGRDRPAESGPKIEGFHSRHPVQEEESTFTPSESAVSRSRGRDLLDSTVPARLLNSAAAATQAPRLQRLSPTHDHAAPLAMARRKSWRSPSTGRGSIAVRSRRSTRPRRSPARPRSATSRRACSRCSAPSRAPSSSVSSSHAWRAGAARARPFVRAASASRRGILRA